jgi:hypothetical protein
MIECIENQLHDRDHCLLLKKSQKMSMYVSLFRVHIIFIVMKAVHMGVFELCIFDWKSFGIFEKRSYTFMKK